VEVSGTSKFYIPNNLDISRSLLWTAGTGSGDAQSLTINTQRLTIRDGGTVQATTFATGEAGDVFINASELVEVSGFSFSPRDGKLPSNLSTSSFGSSNAGSLIINTDNLTVRDGAEVAVNSTKIGNAGDILITANSLFLDRGLITGTTTSGQGGNLTLEIAEQVNLINNSQISAAAGTEGGGGNGGNITIDTPFIIASPFENSDITANAFEGNGGNIDITANGLFGIEFRAKQTPRSDITASSEFGLAGIVVINNPDVDPTSGLVELPDQTTEPGDRVIAGCAGAEGNSFTVTGRGGLPEDPTTTIRGQTILPDLRDFTELDTGEDLPPVKKRSRQQVPTSIVQVNGWVVNQDGEVELVAALPQEASLFKHPKCQDLRRK
jgi:large exoprotein involved in heme utilization and adhesion